MIRLSMRDSSLTSMQSLSLWHNPACVARHRCTYLAAPVWGRYRREVTVLASRDRMARVASVLDGMEFVASVANADRISCLGYNSGSGWWDGGNDASADPCC